MSNYGTPHLCANRNAAIHATYLIARSGLARAEIGSVSIWNAWGDKPGFKEPGHGTVEDSAFDVHPSALVAYGIVKPGFPVHLRKVHVGGVDAVIDRLGSEHWVGTAEFPGNQVSRAGDVGLEEPPRHAMFGVQQIVVAIGEPDRGASSVALLPEDRFGDGRPVGKVLRLRKLDRERRPSGIIGFIRQDKTAGACADAAVKEMFPGVLFDNAFAAPVSQVGRLELGHVVLTVALEPRGEGIQLAAVHERRGEAVPLGEPRQFFSVGGLTKGQAVVLL